MHVLFGANLCLKMFKVRICSVFVMVDYYDLGFIPHEVAVVIILSMVCPSCFDRA